MAYSEQDLIVPALEVMRDRPGGVTTTQLIKELTRRLGPTGRDAEIIAGRRDTYFSQKVRNLKSHDTLTSRGLATYEFRGKWRITDKGLGFVQENKPVFEAMRFQGFRRRDIQREIERDDPDVIIEEGAMETRTTRQRERSQKLRDAAMRTFQQRGDGRLLCEACRFDFQRKYGEHGRGFIEIHHKQPVHEMEMAGSRARLEEALRRVSPVCSNCHRMIHRKRGEMLSINRLKEVIRASQQRSLPVFRP